MTDTDDALLADLLDKWETLHEAGSDVSAAELAGDYVDLIPELEKRIKALKATAWLNEPLDQQDNRQLPQDFGLPTHLGRYELQSLIGSGGFGQVWNAFDSDLHRSVAIKVPHPDRIGSDQDAERFMEEARRVAQLSHPGIVPVHDVGRQDGIVYIVSELISGQSLKDLIAAGPIPATKAIEIIHGVAVALDHAHARGFIHRDIKPANILIGEDGQPKLADFGIATSSDQNDMSRLGTVAYMSPEQLAGKAVNARSDLYSLGVVLYQLLTSNLPRPAGSVQELRASFEEHAQPSIPNSIPAKLRKVLNRCLHAAPENRYGSAKELVKDLEAKSKPLGLMAVSIPTALILIAVVGSYFSSSLWKSQDTPRSIPPVAPSQTQASKATTDGYTTLAKHQGPVQGVELLPSASMVASTEGDGHVQLTRLDGTVVSEIEHDSPVTTLAAIGDDTLATGDTEGVIRLWDVRENPPKELTKLTALTVAVTGIAVNPNGDYLVASSADGKIVLYVRSFDPPRATPLHEAVGDVITIQFTDTTSFAIGMSTNDDEPTLFRAYYLNPENGELHPTSNTPMVQTHHTTAMAVSDEGKFILTACTGSGISTWRWEGKSLLAEGTFAEHSSPVTAVAVVPKGNRVVSADEDGIVRLWGIEDQTEETRVDAGSPITCLRASAEHVLIGTSTGEVRIWRLPNQKR